MTSLIHVREILDYTHAGKHTFINKPRSANLAAGLHYSVAPVLFVYSDDAAGVSLHLHSLPNCVKACAMLGRRKKKHKAIQIFWQTGLGM